MQCSSPTRLAILGAVAALVNGGKLRIYAGDIADVDDPASGTLLAELSFSATAFATPTDDGTVASIGANPIAKDQMADATGVASSWRVLASNGTSTLLKGSVSVAGGSGELQLASTSLLAGAPVEVTSMVLRCGQGN